jgi:hypothetical protein
MKKITTYTDFSISEANDQEEESKQLLVGMIENMKEDIIRHFRTRLMDADFLEIDSPTEFIVEYFPKSFDGRVPKRISYYLDDLAGILSEELGVKVDWNFSPNGNVQRIIFTLEKELDPKFIKVKQSIRLS